MQRWVIVRGIVSVAIGILLIAMRELFMPFLVQCVGVVFILPALFVLATFVCSSFWKRFKTPSVMSLLSGFGTLLFGLWLILKPYFFVEFFMLFLGIMIFLFGFYQIVAYILARRKLPLPLYMTIIPLMLIVVGLIVMIKPFGIASIPFLLLGIASIIGGISDIINAIIISRKEHSVDVLEIEVLENK